MLLQARYLLYVPYSPCWSSKFTRGAVCGGREGPAVVGSTSPMQEVQIQLYQSELSAVFARAKVISSCFLILEAAVAHIAVVSENHQNGVCVCVGGGGERVCALGYMCSR